MTSNQDSFTKGKTVKRQHLFIKDLKSLMYGFGDDRQPALDSVRILEDIVIDYINEMVLKINTIVLSYLLLVSGSSSYCRR